MGPRLPRAGRLAALAGLAGTCALLCAVPAWADAEQDLGEKYAPVVRLVEQTEECGPGEPYRPMDVDRLFGDSTVALRGPWNSTDLVKIGPTAKDLAGLFEYHLDFPGSALDPGCDYERWARRLEKGSPPTVYAHVATDPTAPGKVALQYWFFYAFNDFNNKHEGDWEMIQLVFDAPDASEALRAAHPTEAGYSSHEGAERATWGDEKLEVVDDTHPVVYPAAGSHANKFTSALYIGSSADAGVGCDDTRGPHVQIRPVVRTIPSDAQAAASAYPWITYEGRWGELQQAFFNGPTGPNLKTQWTAPLEWADGWRDRSYAVPTGGVLGTGATDFFCTSVERGSSALIKLLRNPGATVLVLGLLVAALVFAIVKATWTPVAPFRVARRRAWGQILSGSARMYVGHLRLFLGLGVLLIPVVLAITVLQWLLLRLADAFGSVTGDLAGLVTYLSLVVGLLLTLGAFGVVQTATARALVELDGGRKVNAADAYRFALRRLGPLLATVAVVSADLGRADDDGLPDPRRDLACRPLVAPRAGRGAGRPLAPRRAPAERRARARALDPRRLARRAQHRDRARRRPAGRRAPDLRVELLARAPEPRRGRRLCVDAAVRRPRDHVRLHGRPHEARARRRRGAA